jgi:hypothetical protein
MLFIADLAAMANGRSLPSSELEAQGQRLRTLEDQQSQQSYIDGMSLIDQMLKSVAHLPKRERVAILATQVDELAAFSPQLGAIGLTIAAHDNEADVLTDIFTNPEFIEGTELDKVMQYITAVAATDAERAGNFFESAIKEGVFTEGYDAVGPSIIQQKLGTQIEVGRRTGGEAAELANKVASGTITAEEYAIFNSLLPERVKSPDAIMESVVRNPKAYFSVFPGFTSADIEELRRKNELEGNMIAMVNPDTNTMTAGLENSKKIIDASDNGFRPISMSLDALEGGEGDPINLFRDFRPDQVSEIQEEARGLRGLLNSLTDLQNKSTRFNQTFPARLANAGLGAFEGLFGANLSPEHQEFREEFIAQRTSSLKILNEELNRLSGAAVSQQEFERISETFPDPSDDPTEFMTNLRTRIALASFSIARINVLRMMLEEDGTNAPAKAFNLTRSRVRDFVEGKMFEMKEKLQARPGGSAKSEDVIDQQVLEIVANQLGIRPQDMGNLMRGSSDTTFIGDPRAKK